MQLLNIYKEILLNINILYFSIYYYYNFQHVPNL